MRFLSDENFNGAILRGLIRRLPELDLVRCIRMIQLFWNGLRTRDGSYLPMTGVIEVIATAPIGKIIDDLELFIHCGEPEEYENQVLFIPFS